jgi:hypothetical protein
MAGGTARCRMRSPAVGRPGAPSQQGEVPTITSQQQASWRHLWGVKLHDPLHIGDVQAAGRHIRAQQHACTRHDRSGGIGELDVSSRWGVLYHAVLQLFQNT